MAETDQRPRLEPSAEHPITIEPAGERVRVTVAGAVVADSERALVLRESSYRPVHYFPPEDIAFDQLEATDHASYCPFKGDAGYYSVPAGGERSTNAVWQYSAPYPAVAKIAGHVAFYPDRVDSIG